MEIIVRNNNIVQAYKLLMEKLKKDRLFITLKEKQAFKSNPVKKREKATRASNNHKKKVAKKIKEWEKEERFQVFRIKTSAKS